MIDRQRKTVEITGRDLGHVKVTHHAAGAIGNEPEHYELQAGPGIAILTPEKFSQLVVELTTLRKVVGA
jgi:hypothetical protein